ncbi:MAG TPA: Gfo/Idh/MocA family oxidoreductase [Vicinamibacteria bacterium]|nr:Gfo/Idh/MocA family oxidoreductase [Vicinamibacteria bacterium]
MTGSRRLFIEGASLAALGLGLARPREAAGEETPAAPSDRVRFGVVGCNGMGWADMRSALRTKGVECAALADVDQSVLDTRAKDALEAGGRTPRLYRDYRKLLEDRDIDAVIIGTPDHWHCLVLADALAAGKHVYVEKPLANSIEEARAMVAAARRAGRIVQVGQWQRSAPQYAQALNLVRSGALGNIRLVKTWAYQGWMKPVPVKPDSAAPPGVDYDMWLGPAPKRPFNPNRFHFTFRWFWDYAGGLMTDWGVHEIDVALWVMDAKAPRSVAAAGGKLAYPDDASETPDTLQAVFEYDGFNMLWEHATGIDGGNYGRTEGIAFIGNNGTLVVNRGGLELLPETTDTEDGGRRYRMEAIPSYHPPRDVEALDLHTRNFVDAIRKNDASMLTCGIETGSLAAINAHMGNIAYKVGRKVRWDPAAGAFAGDAEANALIAPPYHNGWRRPPA